MKIEVKDLRDTVVVLVDADGKVRVAYAPKGGILETHVGWKSTRPMDIVVVDTRVDPLFNWTKDITMKVSRPVFDAILEHDQRLEPETGWEFKLITSEKVKEPEYVQ